MKNVLPLGRWVLHSAPLLGGVTDRWIDLQARLSDRYDSRLLGGRVAPGAVRAPHWIVAADKPCTRLAYRWMHASRGYSVAWGALALRERRPKVVHAHFGDVAALQRPFARALGSALVASFYGYDATKAVYQTERRWRRAYGKLFEQGAAVIAEGPAMAARVERLGCASSKIHVVRMPADAEALATARRPKADHFLVVAAGRFIEKKGFDTAIKAFARALRGRTDARLLLLGGGELELTLRELAHREGIDAQTTWRDRLPFADFMGEISRAHVGVYPSRTASSGDSEGGAPVTLIEAQWLGVPALVSDHDDLPFVAAPNGSIVLPPLNVDRWAESLAALYDSSAELDAMAGRATEFAQDKHAPTVNLAAREAVYDEVS
jgi:colanic acid/amylovoran biosynthesis glycosyltransferase